ncbi:hypothetical protein BHU72_03525 [Desulfuribacillus stibiiarsenatis]|uniref:Exopolyphosphatase n=1 Tax=Desulfuribacillus stibiiarsenatis TaxID=1390249 RepID=A0A1E5L6V7_9FIRM|nr:bifunctional oligoribonuclease/PAP phosphatase NrnA [Desulfuribacillus stibiiarsenatis]OEH85861.1 hypothetical protein BHU72_03525 [Desulfuribacillus stibiiarsenatis]
MINTNTTYASFTDFIKGKDNFLIVSHFNPDGDTLGSALAIANILDGFSKQYTLVNRDVVQEKYLFLPKATEVLLPESLVDQTFQYVITVDCADYQRIGDEVTKLLTPDVEILNIDHHPTNTNFGSSNIVEADAASTTFIIYNLCKKLEIPLNLDIALCLYTGLMTDTGSFQYSNTNSEVHSVAAELISYGINVYEVVENIFETSSVERMVVLKKSLNTLEIDSSGKIAWLEIIQELSTKSEDIDGLVNYPRSIKGVEVAISFKQVHDGKVRVGLRSKKYVDVSLIAMKFQGGGHKRAAGCTIDGTVGEVKEVIVQEIKKYII